MLRLALLLLCLVIAVPVKAQIAATQLGPVFASRVVGSLSFLRVYDPNAQNLTISVNILAADSGRILGTWSATIPPHAARQFSIAEIEAGAVPHLDAFSLPVQYSLAISGDAPGFLQHVIWRPADLSLTDASTCGTATITPTHLAVNVHTTNLAAVYPDVLTTQNTSNISRDANFDVYDSVSGSRVGTYTRTVPANGAVTITPRQFESDTGFLAQPDLFHRNFVLAPEFPGSVTHGVVHAPSGTVQPMSQMCALPGTASDGVPAPILPATSYAYADNAVILAAIYTNANVQGSAARTDNTPAGNPITDAGATLGRVLFYDKRLSANNTVACASCHQQAQGFGDAARLSTGFDGGVTARHSMALTDARFYDRGRFFWDERAATLEDQVLQPIQNPVEMGMTLDGLVAKLSGADFYGPLFRAAFGTDTVTSDRISRALAQFVRSITSSQSNLDRAIAAGNVGSVLTAQEQQGQRIFNGQGNCNVCHTTNAQVLDAPHNNGLDLSNNADQGAGNGRFKAPSLRNVAVRGRYMHDGRFSTLEQVVDFYDRQVQANPNLDRRLQSPNGTPRRLNLSAQEKTSLVAFLRTLTDQALLTDVRLSNPFPQ